MRVAGRNPTDYEDLLYNLLPEIPLVMQMRTLPRLSTAREFEGY